MKQYLMPDEMRIFTGNSNPRLASEICGVLDSTMGKAVVKTFSDGESWVEIKENVRGMDIFVVQSTCPPVNDNIIELLVMIDALKRASSERITAIIPYYGYARQDRKVMPRTPISAKLMADLITTAGVARVLCMDLHAGQIQGFFNIPVDNIYATPVLLDYLKEVVGEREVVVVAPDAGGVERARAFSKRLGGGLAIIDKRRDAPNEAKAMHIIGDVKGKDIVILDDIVDTAGTLTQSANALSEAGANDVYACATHPILSGPALDRLEASSIKKLIVTNTIPLNEEAAQCGKVVTLSVAGLLATAIKRIYARQSVSSLFV